MYYTPKPFGAWHPTWPNPAGFNHDTAKAAKANLIKVYGPDSGHVVVEFRIVPVETVHVVGEPEPWKED